MNRRLLLALAAFATVGAVIVATAFARGDAPGSTLPVRSTAGDTFGFTEQGGLTPLADAKTVEHWSGSFTDPTNHVTYPFTMVGKAPSTNGSSTTPVDIVPVRLEFAANGGAALDGTDRAAAVQASPIFQSNDYSHVPDSSGGPGVLSPGNVGQLEDVTMRSQFNTVGTGYHVLLGAPTVHATEAIKVPVGKGLIYATTPTGAAVVYGLVDYGWFSSKVQEILGKTHIDSTHLPIVLTDNVMLADMKTGRCCTVGYHGVSSSVSGNGKQQVQTYIFSAYSTKGVSSSLPYMADIHALSHEVAEWGDDPFLNNTVNPWSTPAGAQYGCTSLLETGDPVVGIGFNVVGNTKDGWNPMADGTWHPEDEAFLPWFSREAPNRTSEPTQSSSRNPSSNGRYTLMGDLNTLSEFHQPAGHC
jgi:hypothetical protein